MDLYKSYLGIDELQLAYFNAVIEVVSGQFKLSIRLKNDNTRKKFVWTLVSMSVGSDT